MRLSIKKSGNDTIYYVLDSARHGDKVETWTVKKIGKHSELLKTYTDPKAYAESVLRELNDAKKENRISFKQTIDFDEKVLGEGKASDTLADNVGWLYIKKLFEMTGLPDFLESVKGKARYSLKDTILLLTVGRILSPCSIRKTHSMTKDFLGMPQSSLESLYRALGKLQENGQELQKCLYDGISKFAERDESVIYYDCTNFYSETEEEDPDLLDANNDPILYGMRKYGASKEHRPNPIVQMGLFIDHNGLPISYGLFPGSQNEQDDIIKEEQKMIDVHRKSSFIYCADGGLNSYECRLFNSIGNRGYIVTQSLKKKAEEEINLLMKDMNWRFIDNDEEVKYADFRTAVEKYANGEEITEKEKSMISRDMIYKEFPTTFNVNLKSVIRNIVHQKSRPKLQETIYLTFSAKCFLYQRGIFNRQFIRAQNWVDRGLKKRKNPNSPERFIEETHATRSGEAADKKILTINDDQVDREMSLHGFYAVASNLDTNIHEIMRINKRRWMIEMSFRTMKSVLEARPFYKSTAEGIRGHFDVCFTALSLLRALEQKLSISKNNLTEEDIIKTLRNMEVIKEEKPDRYMAIYTGSKTLEKLEEIFNIGLNRKYYKPLKLSKLSDSKEL